MIDRLRRVPMAIRALRLARTLESHDRWSPERVRDHQRARLLETVRYAAANSPYYRERFAGIELSDDLDLRALPTLDKPAMLENFDDLLTDRRLTLKAAEQQLENLEEDDDSSSDPLLFGEYRVVATGGTSGRRGVFVYDRASWEQTLAGVGLCWGSYFGSAPRLPRRRLVALTANHPVHIGGRWNQSLDIGAHRLLRLDARTPVSELVQALNAFRPESINTYPSIAALLAERQLAGELKIAPEVVGTIGEVLTAEMRKRIIAAWGEGLFDYYGASEVGVIGVECDHHAGLHVLEDQVLIEILDDEYRPVPPGEAGSRLLVTGFANRTQPLIRYELNDLVTVSTRACACGRPFPLLESVGGRSDDVLELPATGGGAIKVHPIILRSPLAGIATLSEYRIVHRVDELRVEAVLNGGGDGGPACREIETRLAAALRDGGVEAPPIRVETVGTISRHATSGKHKAVVVEPAQVRS